MAQSTTQSRGITLPPITVTANSIVDQIRADAFSGTSAGATESQLRDQNAFDLVAAQRRTPGVQLSRYNPVGTFGGDAAPFISAVWRSAFPGVKSRNIDGIPFYMGVWNHPLLDLLPVNGMRSFTVCKSPLPQINGNNFASFNLETKQATANERISGGYFSTFIEQADLIGRRGEVDSMLAEEQCSIEWPSAQRQRPIEEGDGPDRLAPGR